MKETGDCFEVVAEDIAKGYVDDHWLVAGKEAIVEALKAAYKQGLERGAAIHHDSCSVCFNGGSCDKYDEIREEASRE